MNSESRSEKPSASKPRLRPVPNRQSITIGASAGGLANRLERAIPLLPSPSCAASAVGARPALHPHRNSQPPFEMAGRDIAVAAIVARARTGPAFRAARHRAANRFGQRCPCPLHQGGFRGFRFDCPSFGGVHLGGAADRAARRRALAKLLARCHQFGGQAAAARSRAPSPSNKAKQVAPLPDIRNDLRAGLPP